MSYILDALRKSEQQRQATQPESVTDRILINPPQPKQKPVKWIAALVISNLLVIGYFVWFFTKNTSPEPSQKVAVNLEKQLPPLTSEKKSLPPETLQNITTQTNIQPLANQESAKPTSPSIAELIERKKLAETPAPIKQTTDKKPFSVKKEQLTHNLAVPKIQPNFSDSVPEKQPPTNITKATPDLNELPYEIRNSLPNLTINVFSYAQQPEDRFVIIDMVKYRTGQLIKGSVKLKEIRSDSIILQYDNGTFKVERP